MHTHAHTYTHTHAYTHTHTHTNTHIPHTQTHTRTHTHTHTHTQTHTHKHTYTQKIVSFCWPSWFKSQQSQQQISARYFTGIHVWRYEYWNEGERYSIWGNGTAPSSQPRCRSITWWRHALSKITLRSPYSVFRPQRYSEYIHITSAWQFLISTVLTSLYQTNINLGTLKLIDIGNTFRKRIIRFWHLGLSRLLQCCILESKTVQFHGLVIRFLGNLLYLASVYKDNSEGKHSPWQI